MNWQHESDSTIRALEPRQPGQAPAFDAIEVDARELGYPSDPVAQRVAVDGKPGGHAALLEVVFD
jgi:hypothetical protein